MFDAGKSNLHIVWLAQFIDSHLYYFYFIVNIWEDILATQSPSWGRLCVNALFYILPNIIIVLEVNQNKFCILNSYKIQHITGAVSAYGKGGGLWRWRYPIKLFVVLLKFHIVCIKVYNIWLNFTYLNMYNLKWKI